MTGPLRVAQQEGPAAHPHPFVTFSTALHPGALVGDRQCTSSPWPGKDGRPTPPAPGGAPVVGVGCRRRGAGVPRPRAREARGLPRTSPVSLSRENKSFGVPSGLPYFAPTSSFIRPILW